MIDTAVAADRTRWLGVVALGATLLVVIGTTSFVAPDAFHAARTLSLTVLGASMVAGGGARLLLRGMARDVASLVAIVAFITGALMWLR
jgi:hypothetical protein